MAYELCSWSWLYDVNSYECVDCDGMRMTYDMIPCWMHELWYELVWMHECRCTDTVWYEPALNAGIRDMNSVRMALMWVYGCVCVNVWCCNAYARCCMRWRKLIREQNEIFYPTQCCALASRGTQGPFGRKMSPHVYICAALVCRSVCIDEFICAFTCGHLSARKLARWLMVSFRCHAKTHPSSMVIKCILAVDKVWFWRAMFAFACGHLNAKLTQVTYCHIPAVMLRRTLTSSVD